MKSIKLMLAMCALATTITKAQFTGQSFYNHSGVNSFLSSGTYVRTVPGFIMGGYVPTIPGPGSANFFIDKVDPNGTFGSPTTFANSYLMFDGGTDCISITGQETNCYGVSVIESPGTVNPAERYALSAAFGSGIVFATLNGAGGVLGSALYLIPPGAIPTKPLVELSITGDHYVVGSYNLGGTDHMYGFKIFANGTPSWSWLYDTGVPGSTIVPRGIVEDTYSGTATPELAVAGVIGGAITTDGFLITLNGATGIPIIQEALASGQTVNESISSIALARANAGYILGGSTDMFLPPERAWMIRLNSNGTIFPGWSTRMNPSTNTGAGEVIAVAERFSTIYNDYEYYGLALSTGPAGGMLVLKLNGIGNPFFQPGNPNNEFLYNDGLGNVALSGDLSLLDAGATGLNTGIHVFGTDRSAPGQFFMDQACFNGASANCNSPSNQNLTTIATAVQGPTVTYNFSLTLNPGLKPCKQQQLRNNPIFYTPTQPCYAFGVPAAPYVGNNSRTMGATGISENSETNAAALSVYPNPVNTSAEISYTVIKAGEVKVSLTDILGQQVKTLDAGYKTEGANTLSLDMSGLNLQTGVYFINVTMNGSTSQQKIIYSKN